MENTQKQVAYLAGLREGLGLDETTREGKLLAGLLEAFQAVQEDLAELAAHGQYLEDYVNELEDRLQELEGIFFEDDDQEGELYEFLCPSCREVFLVTGDITVDDETLEIVCPHCGHRLEPSQRGPAGPRPQQEKQPWASLTLAASGQAQTGGRQAPSENGQPEAKAQQPVAPRRRTRPPQLLDR